MPLTTRKKRLLKQTGVAVAIVLLLLLIILQIASNRLEPFVGSQVKANLTRSTDSLYSLEYSSLSITLASERIHLTGVHIFPNMDVYARLLKQGKAPAALYEIHIPEFSISWLNLYRVFFNKELSIGSILINKPDISIQQLRHPEPGPTSRFQLNPYDIISGMFYSANIKSIAINGGSLQFTQRFGRSAAFSISNLNLDIRGVQIDSTRKTDTTRFLNAASLKLSFGELVYQTPDTLYTISIKDLDFSGSEALLIKSIQLQPNRRIYDKMKAGGKAPEFLYSINLPALTLDSLNLYKLFYKSSLQMGSLHVIAPDINIAHARLKNGKDTTTHVKGDLYDIIGGMFASVQSSQVSISNAAITFESGDQKSSFLKLHNCSFSAYEVLLDSLTPYDPTRFLAARYMEFNVRQLSYLTPDSLYNLKLGRVFVSTKTGSAEIDSLQMIPRYDRVSFGKVAGHKTTRTEVFVPRITARRIDLKGLLYGNQLNVGCIEVVNMVLKGYLDKSIPERARPILLPQQLLANLGTTLTIDTFRVKNFNITYEEVNNTGETPGKATFSNMALTFTNITNNPVKLKANPVCSVTLHGMLFDKGEMNILALFYLNDRNCKFTLNGTLGAMPAATFNTMVTPLIGGRIRSGQIDNATVNITANATSSKGQVLVYYNNLKLEFDKPGEGKSIKERAMDFFANAATSDENPSKGKPLKVGVIDCQRDNTRFILNYLWKSIFSGLKPVVFLKGTTFKETVKDVKEDIKSLKKEIDKKK